MTKIGTKKSNLKTVKWSQIFSFIKFEEEPENGNFEPNPNINPIPALRTI